MADYRKLALDAILSDGKIDEAEIKLLKKALYSDGKITAEECAFLIDLRNAAQKKLKGEALSAKFVKFFFDALEFHVLGDGNITANETEWLRKMLLADGKVDADEMAFLNRLKKKAKSTSKEFDVMFDEMKVKFDKAALKAAKK